jgi:hypothetical protein
VGLLRTLSSLIELHRRSYRVGGATVDPVLIVSRGKARSKICVSGQVSENFGRCDIEMITAIGGIANPAKASRQRNGVY